MILFGLTTPFILECEVAKSTDFCAGVMSNFLRMQTVTAI